jgi:hypothetical protein
MSENFKIEVINKIEEDEFKLPTFPFFVNTAPDIEFNMKHICLLTQNSRHKDYYCITYINNGKTFTDDILTLHYLKCELESGNWKIIKSKITLEI